MSIVPTFIRSGRSRLGALSRNLRSAAGRLKRDEKGAIALMVGGTIFSIVLVIGGSVDVYRYEMLRKRAQNTLDRAVLAASALDQKIADSENVVRSYMKSAGLALPTDAKIVACPKAGPAVCCPREEAAKQLRCLTTWSSYKNTYRTVAVTANYNIEMAFLWLAGQQDWDVPVHAGAEERQSRVEISLVLDVSSSMRQDGGNGQRRIDALKPAASDFVDQVLSSDAAIANTSISIVPFSAQVNMGRAMLDHVGVNREHDYSSCIHFEARDFQAGVPNFKLRDHVGHFNSGKHHTVPFQHDATKKEWEMLTPNYFVDPTGAGPLLGDPWRCPDDPHGYSVSPNDITDWGNAKLKYDGAGVLTNLSTTDAELEYNDRRLAGTKWEKQTFVLPGKQSVFIQEGGPGENLYDHVAACDVVADATSVRCDATKKKSGGPGTNSSDESSESSNFQSAFKRNDIRFDGDRTTITYLSNNRDELTSVIDGLRFYSGTGTANGMLWGMILLDPGFQEYFSSALENGVVPTHSTGPARPNNFKDRPAEFDDASTVKYLVLMTDGRMNGGNKLPDGSGPVEYEQAPTLDARFSDADVRAQFSAVCDAARDQNVKVFTIGFALSAGQDDATRQLLEDCASSPSHYYDVDGGGIDDAFDAIATTIQRVRLTS